MGYSNWNIYRSIFRGLNDCTLYGREGRMKIILIYPENLGGETEKIIIDWLQAWMEDAKHSKVSSPLRYCEKLEVE